jgi:hypothetical protein
VWLFRPGYVQPVKGVRSRTRLYRAIYAGLGPAYPILRRLVPSFATTTEKVGLALIRAARDGTATRILSNGDINRLGEAELRSRS